jgi:hypothetical protein
VLHVLGLLSVSGTFLKSFDNKGSSSGDDANSSDSVFNSYFDLDFDSSPVHCGFLDGFSDLLWVNSESTTLGGEDGRGCNFSTNTFQIN